MSIIIIKLTITYELIFKNIFVNFKVLKRYYSIYFLEYVTLLQDSYPRFLIDVEKFTVRRQKSSILYRRCVETRDLVEGFFPYARVVGW